jgi:hypothetical protein
MEDEECKLSIEDNEGMLGMSELVGGEKDERMRESKDDEGGAAQIQREDRTTIRCAVVNRC